MKTQQTVFTLLLILFPCVVPFNPFETFIHLFFRWEAEGVYYNGCFSQKNCHPYQSWYPSRNPFYTFRTTGRPKPPSDVIRFPSFNRDPDYRFTRKYSTTTSVPVLPVRGFSGIRPGFEENEIQDTFTTKRPLTPPPPIFRPAKPTETTPEPEITRTFTTPPSIFRPSLSENNPPQISLKETVDSNQKPVTKTTTPPSIFRPSPQNQPETTESNQQQPAKEEQKQPESNLTPAFLSHDEEEIRRPLIGWESNRNIQRRPTRKPSTTAAPMKPREDYAFMVQQWQKPIMNMYTSPLPLINTADQGNF